MTEIDNLQKPILTYPVISVYKPRTEAGCWKTSKTGIPSHVIFSGVGPTEVAESVHSETQGPTISVERGEIELDGNC